MAPETEQIISGKQPDPKKTSSWNAATIVSTQESARDEPRIQFANGKYQILRTLGKGGQAHAILALDIKSGERVTLKVARPDSCYLKDGYFDREIYFLGKLGRLTDAVPQLYDFERTKEPHIVTRYIDGESLQNILSTNRTQQFNLEEKIAMIIDVCAPLETAHKEEIIHRDIKPDNILLASNKKLILADWGLAQDPTTPAFEGVIGTLPYISPQQLQGEPKPSCDVYALSAVLYELITGYSFRRFPETLSLAQKATLAARSGGLVNYRVPNVPKPLLDIMERAYDCDPSKRYKNAHEFKTALESYLVQSSTRRLSRKDWTIGTCCVPV